MHREYLKGDSMKISTALVISLLLISGVSCGPTTETAVAPFKLTSDFTSSTSGGTALPGSFAKERQQVEQFVAYAYDDVSSNIAQGHGEYLTSLEVLAGIATDAQNAFQTEMQRRYVELAAPLLSRQEAQMLVVNYAWSDGYGKIGQQATPAVWKPTKD